MRSLAAALLGLALLTGCGATTPSAADDPTAGGSAGTTATAAPRTGRYVALGDSYTAAPYVYLTDVAKGCLRSDANYPSLVAKEVRARRLVDVSCSAAATDDIGGSQRTFETTLPPQIDAVTRDTTLVTLGMGGNDFGLFATLSGGCPVTGPGGQPLGTRTGRRCGQVDVAAATTAIRGIEQRLTRSLDQIHRRAPAATVVLVGYPRITSATPSCPRRLPISRADAVVLDRVTHRLSDAMGAAARASHSRFVDMYAASRGHDVCSHAAWVNGVRTDTSRAAALHPFGTEQQAVADRIAALVR